jgi:hypothetical protein
MSSWRKRGRVVSATDWRMVDGSPRHYYKIRHAESDDRYRRFRTVSPRRATSTKPCKAVP